MTLDDWTCAYRGRDNNRCAAGLFIPDEKYDSKFEGHSLSFILYQNKTDDDKPILVNCDPIERKIACILMDVVEDIFFLQTLQYNHDITHEDNFSDEFKLKLIALAGECNLTYPKIILPLAPCEQGNFENDFPVIDPLKKVEKPVDERIG